jgi:uncharacterized protein
MTTLKFISVYLLTICCLTSCKGQTEQKTIQIQADTSINFKLQTFRQSFWDSLPKPTSWTNDFEGLFSDKEEQQLNSIIAAFEKETTSQICIVTLDTTFTTKEKFNDLALHIANTWGLGQKDKNNGITICISKGHRKIRICNGYGIEKILSDQETKEIMDKHFISKFKEGEYFQGTLKGLFAIIETLRIKLK